MRTEGVKNRINTLRGSKGLRLKIEFSSHSPFPFDPGKVGLQRVRHPIDLLSACAADQRMADLAAEESEKEELNERLRKEGQVWEGRS